MSETNPLHPSILALTQLGAAVAAGCPRLAESRIRQLRELNVPEAHLQSVIEGARSIRREAGQNADQVLDKILNGEPSGCCGDAAENPCCPDRTGTTDNGSSSATSCCC